MTRKKKGNGAPSHKLDAYLMTLLEVIVFGTLIVMSFTFCNTVFSLSIGTLSFAYALIRTLEEDKRVVGSDPGCAW